MRNSENVRNVNHRGMYGDDTLRYTLVCAPLRTVVYPGMCTPPEQWYTRVCAPLRAVLTRVCAPLRTVLTRVWEKAENRGIPGYGRRLRTVVYPGMEGGRLPWCTATYPWWPYYPVYIAQYTPPGTPAQHPADPPRAGWVHPDSSAGQMRPWAQFYD